MIIKKETEYTTNNFYEIKFKELKERVNISHFINGDNLYVISYTDKTTIKGSFNKSFEIKKEDIVTKECLDELLENPHLYSEIIKKHPIENPVMLLDKKIKNQMMQYGMHNELSELYGESKRDFNSFVNKNVYSNKNNQDFEYMQFIKNKNYLKVFSTSNGELFTEPKILDYIGANLDNGTYHLDELVEHLMKRDDISFITNSQSSRYSQKTKILKCPLNGDENGIDQIIDDIPGYNSEEGRDETICIIYSPKEKDIKSLMNWETQDNKKHIWNLDNHIIREILDGEKYRKEPIQDVISEVPKRKFKK